MLGEEILFSIKNQAHKVLGHCLNEQCQLSQCIIVSRQFDYIIDMVPLQRFSQKGVMSYVYLQNMDYQEWHKNLCQRLWQKGFPFLGGKVIKVKFHNDFRQKYITGFVFIYRKGEAYGKDKKQQSWQTTKENCDSSWLY